MLDEFLPTFDPLTLVSLVTEVVRRWSNDKRAESASLVSEILRALPFKTLTTAPAKQNLITTLENIYTDPDCPCRDSSFRVMLHIADSQTFLQMCFRLLVSGREFVETEVLQIIQILYYRHKSDIDKFLTAFDALVGMYAGAPLCTGFASRIRGALKINRLGRLAGPQIRNKFWSFFVDGNNLDEHVLVRGPSGCGKSETVKAIHANSKRADRPLREYNCSRGKSEWNRLVEEIRHDVTLSGSTVWIDELQRLASGKQQQYDLLETPSERGIQLICSSSSDFVWLQDHLVSDFFGRYCLRVFEIAPLKERKPDFGEFLNKALLVHHREIEPALRDALCECHEWPENHREVERFAASLCAQLGDHDGVITSELLLNAVVIFDDPVRTVVTKLRGHR